MSMSHNQEHDQQLHNHNHDHSHSHNHNQDHHHSQELQHQHQHQHHHEHVSPPLKRQRTGDEGDNGSDQYTHHHLSRDDSHSSHLHTSYHDGSADGNGHAYPNSHIHGNTKLIPMEDDDQSRSRNARAQRRHREKRKAHLKALEESVQLLTAQLEDARRQLGQSYATSSSRPLGSGGLPSPISPNHKDFNQMQAENTYLRDENADLRRQLYAFRASYPNQMPGPPPPPGSIPMHGDKPWDEVKNEHMDNGFVYNHGPPPGQGPGPGSGPGAGQAQGSATTNGPGQAAHMSPRVSGQERDGSTNNDTGSNPSTSSGFPPMDRGARSRMMSASSAPSASPYLPATGFPTDPRHHSLSQQGGGPLPPPGSNPQTPTDSRFPQMRYDHMYPPSGPPPHTLPRSTSGIYGVEMGYGGSSGGGPPGREGEMWGPESGPPPFPGPVSYSLSFPPHEAQGEWRDGQQ